ncbi:MAG TPA: site-specific DNA-methyltransferase [Blastocatellia bacterium]|nr:site-specific DNA-methyltransferase [Blastocatellia bacterium]
MIDGSRRIASRQHNKYVADGVAPHQATQVAPPTLIEQFDEKLGGQIESRHALTEKLLTGALGAPFFSDTGFFLYQGDCIDLLSRMHESGISIDLTLTSPPYNIGKEYEQPMSLDEYVGWCASWMTEVYDITSATGAFWLNVGYLEVPGKGLCVPIPYLLWDKSSFYLLQEIVWKYGAGVSAKRRLSPRNEKWLFFVKDPERYTFNLDEIRDPNVKYPHQRKNGKFRCNPLGKNPCDVWEFPKVTTGEDRSSKERTGHPAQFPLGVVERVVRASSNPTDLVLDPFAGSCSAAIAAVGLGRLFVGFELRPDYCELAVERFKQFKRERQIARQQPALF